MNLRMKRTDINRLFRRFSVIAGIIIDVSLSYLAQKLDLPLYLDTVGTITVTLLCGVLPGVLTAMVSNLACCLFSENALYYSIINVLIAVCTAWIFHGENRGRLRRIPPPPRTGRARSYSTPRATWWASW